MCSSDLHNHCRRLVRAALNELVSAARDLDVVMAIEPMHAGCAGDWTFLTDLAETVQLLDAIASPHVKLVFDTYHLGQDRHIFDQIPTIVDQIAVVHLGDGKTVPAGDQNRCCLGDGRVPVAEMVAALLDAGYTGDFDVELIGEDIETAAYDDLICHSKQAYEAMLDVREGSFR